MRNLWLHSISIGAEADNPLVVFRGASIDWASELITRRGFRSTWEFSESWFGSRFGGGTFSEFSEAPSLPPSQLILNFVTLRTEKQWYHRDCFGNLKPSSDIMFTWDWWPVCCAGASPKEEGKEESLSIQVPCSQCSRSSQHGWILDKQKIRQIPPFTRGIILSQFTVPL